ncbi:MAG TPA: ABC transporter permease [Nocardioides sp.]|jgi:peptide/nickel transport system permease protein|uniref:ABC transporter permease n=1 Tax=Nocardioides sp. TaxID=35761 RepID=UPI002E333ADC|nr:ABC transporter permease [Nocardioides sp.]HEX3929222.1 ABC transporter permease [Nocardioides sp.]
MSAAAPVGKSLRLGGLARPLRRTASVLRARPAAAVGLAVLVVIVLVSLAAPLLAPYSTDIASGQVYAPPSAHHWLGTDDGGIDVLSLVLIGGRVSLIVGAAATAVAIGVGGTVGLLSGYFGGWVDMVLMRITDYFLVVPDLVLMIVVATLWGPSLTHVILVIGLLLWTSTARIVRAEVQSVRSRVYVRRARTIGVGHLAVIWRHVLPQIAPLLIANTVLSVATAIFDETSLDFLGLGDPNGVSWGIILEHANDRTAAAYGAWWAVVPAGLCIAAVIVACYLLGQALEDALNPRLKVSHFSIRSWRLRTLVGRGKGAI